MAKSVRTLILPLWGPNGVKNDALNSTEELFGRVVRFYVDVLVDEASLWAKVSRRDRATGGPVVDYDTGEVLPRRPSANEVLTAVEAITLVTSAHPMPPYDLACVPGAREAPTVFRRAAIKRAVGLVSSHRSNLARWERRGGKGLPPGPPRVERFPVTLYKGLGVIVRQPLRSYLRVKLWDGQTWEWSNIPVRLPERASRFLALADETRSRVEDVLGRVKALLKQGLPNEADALRREARPFAGEIAEESATLYHTGQGWEVHLPFAREVRVKRAETQRGENPGAPVTTVDLGVNNLAVAVSWDGDEVVGTLFIPGREHEGQRMGRLGAIRRRQRASGRSTKGVRSNQRRWVRLAQAEENTARKVAREIVDFAKEHGAKVLVFEALNRIPNTRRMGWTRRQNVRRSWWMRGRIVEFARSMALWDALLVVQRDPAFTSKACPRCCAYGERFSRRVDGRGPHHTFLCPTCGWEGNADLVGALNLKKKWDRAFPPLGPLMQAAREAKKVRTALAGLADKSAVERAANVS